MYGAWGKDLRTIADQTTQLAQKGIADEIIVVDSFSSDSTPDICKKHNVKFFQHEFTGFMDQKNYSLTLAVNKYILSLDADEALSEELEVLNAQARELERNGVVVVVSEGGVHGSSMLDPARASGGVRCSQPACPALPTPSQGARRDVALATQPYAACTVCWAFSTRLTPPA